MSSPIPKNIQERSHGLAPNIIQGSGIISRAQILKQQDDARTQAEDQRRQEALRQKTQTVTYRRRPNAVQRAAMAAKAKADKSALDDKIAAEVFAQFKKAKVEGAKQGIDVSSGTFTYDYGTGELKGKNFKGEPTKAAKQKSEQKIVERLNNEALQKVSSLKKQGYAVNGSTVRVTKGSTGNYTATIKGVYAPNERFSVSKVGVNNISQANIELDKMIAGEAHKTRTSQIKTTLKDIAAPFKPEAAKSLYAESAKYKNTNQIFDQKGLASFAKDFNAYKTSEAASDNFIYFNPDVTNPYNVQKISKSGGSLKLNLPGGFTKKFDYLPSKDVITVTDLTPKAPYNPSIEKQIARGFGQVLQIEPASGKVDDWQRQAQKALDLDIEPTGGALSLVYFGSGTLGERLLGKKGSYTEGLDKILNIANKRPIEFASATGEDIGLILAGGKGAKGAGGKAGASKAPIRFSGKAAELPKIETPEQYTRRLQGRAADNISTAHETPEQFSIRMQKQFTAKPKAELSAKEHFAHLKKLYPDIPKTNMQERGEALFKEFQFKQNVKNSVSMRETKNILDNLKKQETFKNPLKSEFAPKEQKTKGGGTFAMPKFTEPRGGGNSLGQAKTLTKEKPNVAAKEFRDLQKAQEKASKAGNDALAKSYYPQEGKKDTFPKLPGLSGSKYSQPKTPLGFGGITGAGRKRKKQTDFDTEYLSLANPGGAFSIKGKNALLSQNDTGLNLSNILGGKSRYLTVPKVATGQKLRIENLLKTKGITKGGSIFDTGFKINNILGGRSRSNTKTNERQQFDFITKQTTKQLNLNLTIPKLKPTSGIPDNTPTIPTVKIPGITRFNFKVAGAYRKGRSHKTKGKGKRTLRVYEVNDAISATLGKDSPLAKAFNKKFARYY